MPVINEFKTIPELYHFLTEEYVKKKPEDPIYRKIGNEWVGIPYQEIKQKTEALALGLASMGVIKETKVAVISENRPEWLYSDLAILGLGAINTPLYPSLTADSVQFILNNSESMGVIVSNTLQLNKVLKVRKQLKYLKFIIILNANEKKDDVKDLHSFDEVLEMGEKFSSDHPGFFQKTISEVTEDDICTLIYTSGTTGEPKGVILTHKNIVSNVYDAHRNVHIDTKDIFLSFLPLCHIFERTTGYYSAFASACKIYYAQSIEAVAANLKEVHPTIITTVPRLFERIYSKIMRNVDSQPEKKQKIFKWAINIGMEYMAAKREGRISIGLAAKRKVADKLIFKKIRENMGGKIRFFICGGAPLSRELGLFFEAVGILILEGYGLTESSPIIAGNSVEEYKFGTVGKLMHSVEVKIAHDGEILARGPNIMKGYYKNKKETDEVLKDGWLHTGDIGVFDGEGYLMITDRKKHLFKTSGGKYVAPAPIENLFLASQYIEQFVLIGDRRMFLSALIVPDYDQLRAYADSHNIAYNKESDLVQNKEILDLMENEMLKFQKKLANFERVRKFALLDKPLSLENGEVTPKLSIKRKVVEERYKDLIEEMYKS